MTNKHIPPAVGEFAVGERDQLLARIAEQAREIQRLQEGQESLILVRDEYKKQAHDYRARWASAVASGNAPVSAIEAIRAEFPLFDDADLDQETHHCEWSVQHDRKRLHALLSALKAQPSGVVLPDPKKEIVAWGHDMGGNYDEGHADGWNDALDEVARLNSSHVSAGENLIRFDFTNAEGQPDSKMMSHDEMRQRYSDLLISNALALGGGPVCAGGVDERVPELSSFVAFADALGLDLRQSDDQWNSALALYEKLIAAYPQPSAALSAPSHGEQVRDNRAEFKREERYMVVKLSKLADDLGGDELSREEQIYRLAHFGKALVECVVVESDWPEYGPTWAAIEARVTGSDTTNQLPGGWTAKPTDDGEGFIISSPRINGVASHFSVFPDSKDYASRALWKMLAAAPSAGSQKE